MAPRELGTVERARPARSPASAAGVGRRRGRPHRSRASVMQMASPDAIGSVIFEHISDAVFATDAGNRVTFWSPSAERLFGYPAAEAIGRPFGDLLPYEMQAPGDEARFFADLAAGRTWRGSGSARLPDGRVIWLESTVEPIMEDGRQVGSVSVSRDVTDARRAQEALRGVESVGRLLAEQGPVPAALDAVLAELERRMGYDFLSLYVREGESLVLGAQRGYGSSIPARLDERTGVIGRVFRTGSAAFVDEVASDDAYVPGDPSVVAEIAVPLMAGDGSGEVLGVLNIESAQPDRLAAGDLAVARASADRLASALLRNRHEQELRDRARLFEALSDFAVAANAILEPERLAKALVDAVAAVIDVDTIVITTPERSDGSYRIRAVRGIDQAVVGRRVEPGDGSTGRAIRDQRIVVDVGLPRSRYSTFLRDAVQYDRLNLVVVPLIRESTVLGAIAVGRARPDARFTPTEGEVLEMLGAQAALALANAQLVAEVSELAIHDGLTGLYNRRHFDAALDDAIARLGRRGPDATLAAIMFDLDHFGQFNRLHGHLAGDAVLQRFAAILRERVRTSDLVARFGGEEFVAILEDCTLADAVALAESVRSHLDEMVMVGADGVRLRATVSAGCAAISPSDASAEMLVRSADVGLFMAKRAGRNRVVAA